MRCHSDKTIKTCQLTTHYYSVGRTKFVLLTLFILLLSLLFSPTHSLLMGYHLTFYAQELLISQSVLIDFLVISCVLRLIIFLSANIVKKLEDSLGSTETVKGYVEVRESASLVSLEFFKSLTSIQPKKLSQDRLGMLTCS